MNAVSISPASLASIGRLGHPSEQKALASCSGNENTRTGDFVASPNFLRLSLLHFAMRSWRDASLGGCDIKGARTGWHGEVDTRFVANLLLAREID